LLYSNFQLVGGTDLLHLFWQLDTISHYETRHWDKILQDVSFYILAFIFA